MLVVDKIIKEGKMTEKRKFKVLWFCAPGGDMKRYAQSHFEMAAEKLGGDYERDFEHHFVWPLPDQAAVMRRIGAEQYDLVMVGTNHRVIEVANEFCTGWSRQQIDKVLIWQALVGDIWLFSDKLRTASCVSFSDDVDECVQKIYDILAAAKR
ncbi:hypothetical protein A2482_05390 [Candidatus Falkowbacteria bacterium RIFOXYC2_FULL_48_21]|uniref:Uncharacterized protein n=1 Tax=Candidatus Falkowbacteria bacterium RIFOXYC2_FULL_48_21 TaxID=1798005 RepID=A0A1F5TI51_9BACT|nr:MAG: hypothetical protein A2482_05390 [Candidatus Falkowbacteria bacterium RIFOXYC2_FULL_48_21]